MIIIFQKCFRLPVIVYIHGGQLSFGGGDEIASFGVHNFVKKYNLVVVSMNYRLGPFGFMTLKEFPDFRDTGMSGNYGLMDQIAALKWVKNNIKNFGGALTTVRIEPRFQKSELPGCFPKIVNKIPAKISDCTVF
jgi:para-nitrobenzyl esterase